VQLAKEIKAAGLGAFPCRLQYDAARNKWSKHPVTVNHEPWAVTAHRHPDDPAVPWGGCEVLGIPVPAGVVVIDLDTYRPGCTTELADALFGGSLPWAAALIQTTIGGGSHYAFRLPDWPVKQGSNFGGPGSGIDTRVAGRGFICSGGGYTQANTFGVLRLAYPDSLPVLPEFTRPLLEQLEAVAPAAAPPSENERDLDTLTAALAFIDPTERDTWRDIGFALKHYFHDDAAAGFEIWDRWSAGQFWPDGQPASYAPDTQIPQWNSFKAQREGATITVGSLFHMAIRAGWQPPARFDTAAAFGANAAPMSTFNGLLERIMESGADSRNVEAIMREIAASGCNRTQALLLRNELKASLKEAKLLDKDLSAAIDQTVTPRQATPDGLYTKNHAENAALFLKTHYPNDTLLRSNEIWYAFNGKCWVELDDATLDHQITMAMIASRPQRSTVTGTYGTLGSMTHVAGVAMNENAPSNLILFQNGILDLYTGALLPHNKKHYTTRIAPYNYDPSAQAPTWVAFLNEIFEGDQERIALLQEWFGYMLAPSYEYQKIMLLIGPTRSGKGTLGLILADLVGHDNYSGASLTSFKDDDFIDSLRTKTVAFSGDTAKNISRNHIDTVVERIKKISGNDFIDFSRKYKSRMACRVPARITLASNYIPRLFDDAEALSNRLLVLPMDVSFAGREDTQLINKLKTEISGIALWSLQGLARLNRRRAFTLPEASKNEMQYIAEMYSPLRAFVDAVCEFHREEEITTSTEIYDAYRAWSLAEGEDRILPRKTFVTAFRDISRGKGCGYGAHRRNLDIVRGFRGLALRPFKSVTTSAFTPALVK
jgi:P4 family phage/plasmid primase-like protien